jgi:hypothetical protein
MLSPKTNPKLASVVHENKVEQEQRERHKKEARLRAAYGIKVDAVALAKQFGAGEITLEQLQRGLRGLPMDEATPVAKERLSPLCVPAQLDWRVNEPPPVKQRYEWEVPGRVDPFPWDAERDARMIALIEDGGITREEASDILNREFPHVKPLTKNAVVSRYNRVKGRFYGREATKNAGRTQEGANGEGNA